MVARRSNRKSGFTLVEILIVVIILGILAAIVIPQFTNASQDARKSSLVSQLQTLRSQIELYKLQHKDTLPDLAGANGWDLLLNKTDADQNLNPGAGITAFGPYLQAVPRNPLNSLDTVTNGVGTVGQAYAGFGFVYDYGNNGDGTGRIWGTDAQGVFYEE